jgi:hypothetical protein
MVGSVEVKFSPSSRAFTTEKDTIREIDRTTMLDALRAHFEAHGT